MLMTFDDFDRRQSPPEPTVPGERAAILLGAAMTSGLCIDLMLERLLDAVSEGRA